jgi:Poly (ADP-ribose) glycohydrolase (PARG)
MNENIIWLHTFNAQNLVDSHPPRLQNANKKLVYQIACPTACKHNGTIVCSRWRAVSLPSTFVVSQSQTKLEDRKNYFQYEPSSSENQVEWYLNFAHSDLFSAYGGSLFAQDEMQVAEHPALASLRESLIQNNIEPLTVETRQPTPIIIRGIERRCAISTDNNSNQGRPFGLYGNNFARATPEAITKATKPLNPPTITNIIAMEAPVGGYGFYSKEEIEYILLTAFTGFYAGRVESSNLSAKPIIIIHTGFWGCGAYGGNRLLMALLQIFAAHLAQVDCLVFHTADAMGTEYLRTAKQILEEELFSLGSTVEISTLVEAIYSKGFQWGVSDGN